MFTFCINAIVPLFFKIENVFTFFAYIFMRNVSVPLFCNGRRCRMGFANLNCET